MNYAKEYLKFEKRMKKQAEEYRNLGMTEEQIEEMARFDRQAFLSDLRFYKHNISLEEGESLGEDMNCLMKKYPDSFVSQTQSHTEYGRFGWINDIDDPGLYAKLISLPKKDLEIITMYAFENCSQEEIAEKLGVSQQTISNRIKGYRNLLSSDEKGNAA